MARGLSDLQKEIVKLAYEKYLSKERLLYSQILMRIYNWNSIYRNVDHSTNCQKFDKKTIGSKNYDSIHASLSRAIKRLEDRGLVKIFKYFNRTEIELTSEGKKKLVGLMVK